MSTLRMASTGFKGSTMVVKKVEVCCGALRQAATSYWPPLAGCGWLLASCGLLWLARGLLLLTAACWRWLDLALALRKGSNKVDSDVWLLSSGAAGL